MSGSRLALARKIRGMNQTQLANSVSITPRAISKYEKESEGISPAKLSEIANVLRFPLSFFEGVDIETPPTGAISFRARSKMTAKQRDQAIAASAFGVLLSDWMDSEFVLPKPEVPDYSGYGPENAARALREAWGLGESPASDMIAILESHGVRVFSIIESSQEIDAYSFWDEQRKRPFIFLSTSKSGERRRMDAAHELGHLVLHRKVDMDGKESREKESEANAFGSAFLMPNRGFRSRVSRNLSLNEVMKIKRFWKVSAFAAVYRAHTLKIISDWQYHNLCVNMSQKGMRTKEPNGIVPETSQVADKILKLTREEYGNPLVIEEETGIPCMLVMGLLFRPSIEVIQGGNANSTSQGTRRPRSKLSDFHLVLTEKRSQ